MLPASKAHLKLFARQTSCFKITYKRGYITPLVGRMKKQQVKRNAKKPVSLPEGRVVIDLVIWSFTDDEDIIRHNAEQLAKALQMSYQLSNFGPSAFGIDDE